MTYTPEQLRKAANDHAEMESCDLDIVDGRVPVNEPMLRRKHAQSAVMLRAGADAMERLARCEEALDRIECSPTDPAKDADENMAIVRAIARAATDAALAEARKRGDVP